MRRPGNDAHHKPLSLTVCSEQRPLKAPFRIAGYVFETADLIIVSIHDGEHRGWGEASGVYYLGENPRGMIDQIESNKRLIETCESRENLRQLLPPGGARNAVDCAMWDLEAKQREIPAWRMAGIQEPRALKTTFTLSANSPQVMAGRAEELTQARALKLKLTGELELDAARVGEVRAVRPEVWLGVDANQGYLIDQLDDLVSAMVAHDVSLIEQPLARGREGDLDGYTSPIPIAADESALTLDDVEGLIGRFDVINIKLDKCGGLTEALLIADAASRAGLSLMVGCMDGTSLATAPAFILAQRCHFVDLDSPTLLRRDRMPAVQYSDGKIWVPQEIWG